MTREIVVHGLMDKGKGAAGAATVGRTPRHSQSPTVLEAPWLVGQEQRRAQPWYGEGPVIGAASRTRANSLIHHC